MFEHFVDPVLWVSLGYGMALVAVRVHGRGTRR